MPSRFAALWFLKEGARSSSIVAPELTYILALSILVLSSVEDSIIPLFVHPIVLVGLTTIVGIELIHLWWCYNEWASHFSARLDRSEPKSPSYNKRPALERLDNWTFRVLNLVEATFIQGSLITSTGRMLRSQHQVTPPAVVQHRAKRSLSSAPSMLMNNATGGDAPMASPGLNMSHTRLTLKDYLWVAHCVLLPLMINFCMGDLIRRRLYDKAHQLGLLPQSSSNAVHETLCNVLLETAVSIMVKHVEPNDEGELIATFVFPNFPIAVNTLPEDDPACFSSISLEGVDTLVVIKINASQRIYIEGEIGGKSIRVEDMLALLGLHSHVFIHPQIHAYANWAVDPADKTKSEYFRKMSIVTVAYNHAGFSSSPAILDKVLSKSHGDALRGIFSESMKSSVGAHAMVRSLAKHSKVVKFITLLRPMFFRLFARCRPEIPANFSAEAYFLGTVLHSIDHSMIAKHIRPMMLASLDVSACYNASWEMVKVFRNFAVDDLPETLMCFERLYKDSPERFHQEVYRAAYKIDPDLANIMQTSIVK